MREARTAEILGKDDALYVPSGTTLSQVALKAHTEQAAGILITSSTPTTWRAVAMVTPEVVRTTFVTGPGLPQRLARVTMEGRDRERRI